MNTSIKAFVLLISLCVATVAYAKEVEVVTYWRGEVEELWIVDKEDKVVVKSYVINRNKGLCGDITTYPKGLVLEFGEDKKVSECGESAIEVTVKTEKGVYTFKRGEDYF